MDQELLGAVEKHYGVTGKWSRSAEERFAKDFQAYVKEGKFANDSIKTAFDRLKAWLIGVYQTLVGSSGNRKISDEIRSVFDDMLGDGTDPVLRKSSKSTTSIDIVNNVLQHMMERAGKVGATKAWDEATMRLLPDRVSAKEREALERELGPIIEKMAGQMQNANRLKANALQSIGIKLEDFEGSLVDHAVRRGAGKGDPLEGKIPLAPTQGKVTRSRADEIRDPSHRALHRLRRAPLPGNAQAIHGAGQHRSARPQVSRLPRPPIHADLKARPALRQRRADVPGRRSL